MASRFRRALAAEAARATERPAGYPFRGPGVWARVIPFATIAVTAEASVALPPGPRSLWATGASIGLLLATAVFLLPLRRLPGWADALVPLTYSASVFALILAAGSTSGVGIVILVPLIWTVLFQRWRDSALVLLAIVIVEIVISIVPVAAPAAVIARRVVLWFALGTVIVVATHGLRDRIARAQKVTARLQAHLRRMTVMEDRGRIAAGIQNTVIQRLFAVGLNLQGAQTLVTQPIAHGRIESAVMELDEAIRALRDSIFAFERTVANTGLRAEVLGLFAQADPAPDVRFSGLIDELLPPEMRGQFLRVLCEASGVIQSCYTIASVDVAGRQDSFVTVIKATACGRAPHSGGGFDAERLQYGAAQAGISLDIVAGEAAARLTWMIPLETPAGEGSAGAGNDDLPPAPNGQLAPFG